MISMVINQNLDKLIATSPLTESPKMVFEGSGFAPPKMPFIQDIECTSPMAIPESIV